MPLQDLTLKIADKEMIELPNWIGSTSLNLQEIGAVVLLSCLAAQGLTEHLVERLSTEEMHHIIEGLKEKKVATINLQAGTLKIHLDLDAVRLPEAEEDEEEDEA